MSEHRVRFRTTWLVVLTWATAIYLYTGNISGRTIAQDLTDDDVLHQNVASLVLLNTFGVLRATGDCRQNGNDAPGTPGVGFYVSSEGHILTAGHVVRRDQEWRCDAAGRPDGRRVKVEGYDQQNDRAEEISAATRNVRVSPFADVALVKVRKGSGRDPVDSANTCGPTGEVVAVVWRDGGSGPTRISGSIQGNAEEYTGGLVKFDVSVGKVEAGDSGSPIFNRRGQLVGILQGMDEQDDRVGFFVPIADAANLLFNVFDVDSCSEIIPTISVRFSNKDMLDVAVKIAEALRATTAPGTGLGYRVPDPQLFETWGKEYEVRYFDPKHREAAEHVAAVTNDLLTDLRSTRELTGPELEVRVVDKSDYPQPPRQELELWLELLLPG
jgi:Trypsin-like peptidase domain